MEKLVHRLRQDYPEFVFSTGIQHCWSPENSEISYADDEAGAHNIEGLLHELGHARLAHERYVSDIDLLQKEVTAWDEAMVLATAYGVEISQNHVQDCLDTYRDWLYKRSRCPACASTGLQQDRQHYVCLNCEHTWTVSVARFQRPYRLSKRVQTKSRSV